MIYLFSLINIFWCLEVLKDRCRKIKNYIEEKKKLENETGFKQTVTKDDIKKIKENIVNLEQKKGQVEAKYKIKVSKQDELVHKAKKELKAIKKKAKMKDKEYR